jgi:hypothetical protein
VLLAELLFLVLFATAAGALVYAAVAALRGRRGQATSIVIRTAVLAAVYVGLVYLAAAVSGPKVVPLGRADCYDDWCFAVFRVDRVVSGPTVRYEVTMRLSSRARRRAQRELGARDVYLVDSEWKRFDPLPDSSKTPFNSPLQPGQAVLAHRSFTVPAGEGPMSLMIDRHDFPFCVVIGECDAFHAGTRFLLE